MATEFQPYVGPRPFERSEADQNRFFGRDYEASELLSRITAHSAVLLYSQSGAGKTSLINAKLIPMLEKAGFEVLEPARVRDVLPDDSVLNDDSNIYAYNVLRNWDEGRTPAEVLARMSIPEFLRKGRSEVSDEEDERPRVVIFDQFEELFSSYQEHSKHRENFFEQVGDALEEDRVLRVVFAMREDFIGELDPYLSLLPEKLRTRFRLERLSEEDALLAITEPLKDTEYSYAEHVAEQLVQDLLMVPVETAKGVTTIKGDSVEPVQLQVACQTLWANCQNSWRGLQATDKKIITLEQLETFGDVDQALSIFYENAIARVVQAAHVKEGVLRRWFDQSLITSVGTRGTVFRGQTETGGIPNRAVDELVNHHIIRGELRGGSRWYELTHDRLIGPIKSSNERWFLAHSGGEQTPKRLETRAKQWVHDGRKKDDLLDDAELLEARRWLDSPNAAELGYSNALFSLVQASRIASDEAKHEREHALAIEQERRAEAERQRAEEKQKRLEEQTKAYRRLAVLSIVIVLLLFIAVGSAVYAMAQWRDSKAAQRYAEQQQEVATRQATLAQQRSEEADAARSNAQSAGVEANRQRELADQRAALATHNAREAQEAKREAEAERREAERQKEIADRKKSLAEEATQKEKKAKNDALDLLEIDRLNTKIGSDTYALYGFPGQRAENLLSDIEKNSESVLVLYRKFQDSDGIKKTLKNLANSFNRMGKKEKALGFYQRALAAAKESNDEREQANMYEKIGGVFEDLHQWPNAIDAYKESVKILEKISTGSRRAEILMNIGKLYMILRDGEAAIEAYQKAQALLNESHGKADALISIAKAYNSLGKKEVAITKYQEALGIYKKLQYRPGQGMVFLDIGKIYKDQHDFDKSLESYAQALSVFKELGDFPRQGMALLGMGETYEEKPYGNQDALTQYNLAFELLKNYGDRKLQATVLLGLSRVYERRGEKTLATMYYRQAEALQPKE